MNAETAEVFMRCHIPGVEGDDDSRIRKAVRAAEKNDVLKAKLKEQTEFDERWSEAVNAIAPPPDLVDRLGALRPAEEERFDLKAAMRQPPFLAACIALVFLLGWGVIFAMNRLENFPGKENVKRLVAINEQLSGMEFEPKTAEVGNLADWLFSRFGFEDFYVPPEYAAYKSLGSRVFKVDGIPVAQFAIEEQNMLFYMFRGSSLGVKMPSADRWNVFEEEGWAAAVQQHEDHCFMIVMRGEKQALERLLEAGAK